MLRWSNSKCSSTHQPAPLSERCRSWSRFPNGLHADSFSRIVKHLIFFDVRDNVNSISIVCHASRPTYVDTRNEIDLTLLDRTQKKILHYHVDDLLTSGSAKEKPSVLLVQGELFTCFFFCFFCIVYKLFIMIIIMTEQMKINTILEKLWITISGRKMLIKDNRCIAKNFYNTLSCCRWWWWWCLKETGIKLFTPKSQQIGSAEHHIYKVIFETFRVLSYNKFE